MHILLLPFEPLAAPRPHENGENQNGEKTPTEVPLLSSLSRFGNRTSLFWVARALADSRRASQITVVCNARDYETLRGELPNDRRFIFADFDALEPFQTPEDNAPISVALARSLDGADRHLREPALVVSCETVLLTGQIVDDLLAHTRENNVEAGVCWCNAQRAQGVVPPRKKSESATAENPSANSSKPLFLATPLEWIPIGVVSPALLGGARTLLENHGALLDSLGSDKGPSLGMGLGALQLAVKLVGWRFLFRAFKHRLQVAEVEKTATKIFGCECDLIELAAPELCLRASEPNHRAAIEKRLRVGA